MDQDEIQLLLDQARITLNKGRVREADKFLDKVLQNAPDNDQALNLKGLLLFKEDRYREAVSIFRRLLDLFPDEPTLLTNLGLALLKSEQLVEAEIELKRALERGGNPEKIHNYLGLTMSGLGRYQEAQEYFEVGGSKKMAEQMLSLIGGGEEEETVEQEVASALENSVSQEVEPANVPKDAILSDDSILGEDPAVPLPSVQGLANPDVLSAALTALQDKFGGVVETQQYGSNLEKLLELLTVFKEPEQLFESAYPNVARISVQQDPVFVRSSLIKVSSGALSARTQNKKYKGKELSAPFGSEEDQIQRVEGSGSIIVESSEGLRFHIIPLEEELIYLVDNAIAAFIGEIKFENGRLPSDDGHDLDLVQFRGTGRIFVQSAEKLVAMPVGSEDVCSVDYGRVVGWFGNTVPSLAANRPPFHDSVKKLVSFKGDGIVLVRCNKV